LSVQFSKTRALVLLLIGAIAIGLSITSYAYSTAASNQILNVASREAKSNAEIQAHDLSTVLANKVESVSNNLELMAGAPTIQNHTVQSAIPLFTEAHKSTGDFASSYFWVGKDGKLLWADSFTNSTLEQQYNGGDRSYRDYYSKPRNSLMPYYSTVIESVDKVPRLYIGYPILGKQADGANTFNGVVVAAINLDTLGKYVQDQLLPNYNSSAGLMDRNGVILYSTSTQYIGENIFGPEVQSILPADIKKPFNQFIRDSLNGNTGSGDFSAQGSTSTIAYEPVTVKGTNFALLYIVTPHQFAGNVLALVYQQRSLNTLIIIAIGAVATGIAAVVLTWNKRLSKLVHTRTSELKSSNESLIESNRRLEVVNEQLEVHDRMQKEFVNIAAHELKTPIQPILGLIELAEMNKGVNGQGVKLTEEEFGILSRSAKRLDRLSSDLLEVSKIESKALKLDKEKFDLNVKIQTVIKDVGTIQNGQKLQVTFEPKIRPIFVNADKPRIFEVIANLLRNAIKFTKDGSISITSDIKDNQAVVTMKDTGSGINPEVMPRLFEKFVTKSEKGTGLGLFISKNIIEAHGGSIWAENNENGKGATFGFSLPLAEKEQEEKTDGLYR